MEDSFSMGVGWGGMVQAVMRAMGSNGERQMKLHSLDHCLPPAVLVCVLGFRDPRFRGYTRTYLPNVPLMDIFFSHPMDFYIRTGYNVTDLYELRKIGS